MCGRYTLSTPAPELADLFGADWDELDVPEPRFNVAPTDDVLVVRPRSGGRELTALRWGLIPGWAEARSGLPLMINARVETLEVKRAFRDLIPSGRCAIVADGFYEWRLEGGLKQPYFIRRRDGRPLAFAGLWDLWSGPDDDIESCTIITTEANELLRPLHDRMPVVLDEHGEDRWLTAEIDARTLDSLVPFAPEELEVYPVGTRVNAVAHDDPGCIEPIDATIRTAEAWSRRPSVGPAPADQLGLF